MSGPSSCYQFTNGMKYIMGFTLMSILSIYTILIIQLSTLHLLNSAFDEGMSIVVSFAVF